MIFGIDISTYQEGISLTNAKKDGVKFAIIRGSFTGYGKKTLHVDKHFIEHYNNAQKAGLDIGIYHYSCATTYEEGKKEAEFLYNNCLKGRKFTYPIYIDVEDNHYQSKVGKAKLTEAIKGFCEYIESINGYVGIYCNLNFANNYLDYNSLRKKYDFWLAYYGNNRPNTSKYKTYGMWQFGGSTNYLRNSKVAGFIVDQNYSYNNYPQIINNKNLNDFTNKEEKLIAKNNINEEKYIVKKGDTLTKIALKYKTTWQKIYNDNKAIIGNNPNRIYPNQELIIK